MDRVRIEKNIVYSGGPGDELMADLYFPANAVPGPKMPVVILVHGDAPAPNMKDSGQYTSLGRIVAASGMVGVTFNHRALMLGFSIKDVLSDIKNLISFLSIQAEGYGFATDEMALWSFSSGVPFTLYAGMQNELKNIKCMAAYYGFGDFMTLCKLLDQQPGGNTLVQQAEEYSTVRLLQQNTEIPPMLIARAGMDQIPNLLHSLDSFVQAVLQNNIEVDVYNHSAGVHAFDLMNDHPRTHEIIEKTLEFFKQRLK